MEVTKTICSLKSVLNQLERILECDFENVGEKNRGNTQLLDVIVSHSQLLPFFQNEDDDELRKLHFLLFLNTGLKNTSALESDRSVGHMIGVIPRLSFQLYFALVRRYNLLKYANEILELGPVTLATELLEVVLDEEKYLPTRDRFEILGAALQCVSVRIMKTDCKFTLKRIADFFRMMMLSFNEPDNVEEDDTKKSVEQMTNKGYKFASITSLLYEMTLIVHSEDQARDSIPLYNLEIPYNAIENCSECELKSKIETIRECYESVFFKCREVMEQLDLDTFLTWYEVKMDETNLQTFISEKVFHLYSLLEEKRRERRDDLLPASAQDLILMLRSVCGKPTAVDKAVCHTNVAQLEEIIASNATFDEQFFERVECFLEHASFTRDIGVTFVRRLFNAGTRPNVNPERIKRIIVQLLRNLETDDLSTLLTEVVSAHGPNHFMIEKENDFKGLIAQLHALCAADDIDSEECEEAFVKDKERQILSYVALMSFHATSADLKVIIKEGCSGRYDTSVILRVLEKLEPLCLYEFEFEGRAYSALVQVFKEFLECDFVALTMDEKDNFTHLMIVLSSHKLLHSDDFLSAALLPLLYANENSNWSSLADFLLLFKNFYEEVHHASKLCLPILLVQMGQILEDSRWSIATFSINRLLVCERAIEIIHSLMENPKAFPTHFLLWMEDQLIGHSYLTRFHFAKICRRPSSVLSSRQIETIMQKSYEELRLEYSQNENEYMIQMGQLILHCTQDEFRRIIENYTQGDCHRARFLFDWISDSISFISNVTRRYSFMNVESIEVVYNCLGHLVINFLDALQKSGIYAGKLDYIRYINRIISVVRIFPEHLIGPYQFNIIKFLVEELPEMKKTTHDFNDDIKKLLVGLFML